MNIGATDSADISHIAYLDRAQLACTVYIGAPARENCNSIVPENKLATA